jgi:hypothetical protein
MESETGFSDPAAKGAMVKGMSPAATILYMYCQPLLFSCSEQAYSISRLLRVGKRTAHTSQNSSDSFHDCNLGRVLVLDRLSFRESSVAEAARSGCAGWHGRRQCVSPLGLLSAGKLAVTAGRAGGLWSL